LSIALLSLLKRSAYLTSAYYNSLLSYFAPNTKVFKAFFAFYIKL
jgi:hypothetical protein